MNKVLFLFILISNLCQGQDLFDVENTERYASYLFQSKNYKLATEEYSRLHYMEPNNIDVFEKLVVSCRLDNQFDDAIHYIERWSMKQSLTPILSNELLKNYFLSSEHHPDSSFIIQLPNFSIEQKHAYIGSYYLISGEFDMYEASYYQDTITDLARLNRLIYSDFKSNVKHWYWMSIPSSIILPGSGKMLLGEWKDGLVSFVMTGIAAFQFIRGYQQQGLRNSYTILYGGLATGFYLGNVYGTVKSYRKKKNKLKQDIQHRAQKTLYSHF